MTRLFRDPIWPIRVFLYVVLFTVGGVLSEAGAAIVGEEPRSGEGLPPEVVALQEAAGKGSAEAAFELGKIYAEGRSVFADQEKSEAWLRRAVEADLTEAVPVLAAVLLRTSDGADTERTGEALTLLRESAETNPGSALTLGQLHTEGRFVSQDFSEAERHFEQATELGSSSGWLWLGRLYSGEIGFAEKSDPGKVGKFLQKAVEEGNSEASRLLVKYLREGTILPKDEERAFRIAAQVAAGGNPEARFFLGTLHEEGSGTPVDPAEALASFLDSAQAGNAKAMNRLGKIYALGELGEERDADKAMDWFREAVEAGSPEAALGVAMLLDRESPVGESDSSEVVKAMVEAASAGVAEAQDRLGSWYRDGYRLPKDVVAAAAWFRMAANSGHVTATINLAQIMEANLRTAEDLKSVLELYGAAANAGHPVAHFHLARMLVSGIGGVSEPVRAHAHASKSAESGFLSANDLVTKIAQNLNQEQIAESLRLQQTMSVLPWSEKAE